jgi:hypothetical protein
MTVLTGETLARLNADVSLPRYDRRHVRTGIVHIGVGNFHRSHQAMYIDTLMDSGGDGLGHLCATARSSVNWPTTPGQPGCTARF